MRIWFACILLIGLPAQAAHVAFEAQTHIAQKSPLYLSDVAAIKTDDEYTTNALKAIQIADSAQDAEKMTVQDIIKKIKPSIKAIERHCDCKLTIEIPKEIMNHSLNGEFNVDKLVQKVEMGIKEHCPDCVVDIEGAHAIRGDVPEQYTLWSLPIVYRELKGTSMIRVFFDDNALNPVIFQAYIKIKKPVLRVARPLPAGTAITNDDFQRELIDVTHESRVFATVEDLTGTELKRSLGVGEYVHLPDLILKYDVKLGEPVKVVVKNSSLEVEMPGVAQKSGRVGDKIPVRLAATRKDVFGEVLRDGKVGL